MALLVCIVVLTPAVAAAGYYLALALLGRGVRCRAGIDAAVRHRISVLIPAHNEVEQLPRTLHSLGEVDFPADMLRVVVVADQCTDGTAEVARRCGAEVVERCHSPLRGKGHALAEGLRFVLASTPDAVLILDADCTVSPGLLLAFDRLLSEGVEAAQARVCSRNAADGPAGLLAAVGSEVDHAVACGRQRLGVGVPLRGTGMLFRRELLARLPWAEHGLTEDAEYAARLTAAGVRVHLVPEEFVRCEAPPTSADLLAQRRRWRAALTVPGGNWLTSKPLVLIGQVVAAAVVVSSLPFLDMIPAASLVFILLLTLLAAATPYLHALARVQPIGWRSLLAIPTLIARLGWLAATAAWSRDRAWLRTRR